MIRVQCQNTVGKQQRKIAGNDLQNPNAKKALIGDHPGQTMEKMKDRSFMIEHITVQNLTVEHGFPHGEEGIRIYPVIQRIQRRRKCCEQHRQNRNQSQDQVMFCQKIPKTQSSIVSIFPPNVDKIKRIIACVPISSQPFAQNKACYDNRPCFSYV